MSEFDNLYVKIGLGKLKGHQAGFKFGENSDVDPPSIPQDVIAEGGLVQFLPIQESCTIVSTDTNDNITGTGSQQVEVFGINGANDSITYVSEVVELNGTTPVALQNEYRLIYRITNVQSGSNRINEGDITITSDNTDTELALMPTGVGNTLTTLFAVAKGYKMLISHIYADIGRGTTTTERAAAVSFIRFDVERNAQREIAQYNVRTGTPVNESFRPFLEVTENTFVWFRVNTVSQNDTNIRVNYVYDLVKVTD